MTSQDPRRRKTAAGIDGQITTLKTPKQRMRKTFRILRGVIDSATNAALSLRYDRADAGSVELEVAVFGRALNALKAVRLLCEQAHWEFASSAVRQLFELVINIEHLNSAPDRRAALRTYGKYGLLQVILAEVKGIEYDQSTGRPFDAERLAMGRQILDGSTFDEFRKTSTGGAQMWAKSWSGKNARELATMSPSSLRAIQYKHLFSDWSEQTHGTPGAVVGSFVHGGVVAEVVARDEVRIAETVASAVTLFVELWSLLDTLPGPDPNEVQAWQAGLLAEAKKYGAGQKPQHPPTASPLENEVS